MNITITYKSGTVVSITLPLDAPEQAAVTPPVQEPVAPEPEQPIQEPVAPTQETIPVEPPKCSDGNLLRFTCSDGDYTLPPALLKDFYSCFGNSFTDEQLAMARLWCETNPTKRKTRRGMGRFLNAWLCRAKGEKRTPLSARGSLIDAPTSSQDGW